MQIYWPEKNKNNFTCLLLYQLVTNCLFSHKNIKLFLQWLLSTKGYQFSISCFSNANELYVYFSDYCLLFYSQRITNFSGSFQPFVLIRKKLVIFVHFKDLDISQKPKSSPLSYFAQEQV
jgi:hypothetical protein